MTYDPAEGNNHYCVDTAVVTSADLAIGILSDPPAILPRGQITYTLSITNIGPSDAQEVNVVDILPEGVSYQGTYPPNICQQFGLELTCSLETVSVTDTQILIYVTDNITDSWTLIDTASVSSTTDDPNDDNNTSEVVTVVDNDPPVVHWLEPCGDGCYIVIIGGVITLTATATDNDEVDWVEFRYFDPYAGDHGDWVSIGIVTFEPYSVMFNVDTLVPLEYYYFEVRAYDRVGHISNKPFIYIQRVPHYSTFIPIVAK
jgi:uncharacterized repeat protein (TIGR01451 family)